MNLDDARLDEMRALLAERCPAEMLRFLVAVEEMGPGTAPVVIDSWYGDALQMLSTLQSDLAHMGGAP